VALRLSTCFISVNCTKNTDWSKLGDLINNNINLHLSLKEQTEIDDAVQHWTTLIQIAAWRATPVANKTHQLNPNVPLQIREMVVEKRQARRKWQISRNILDKPHLNRLTHKLRAALNESRNASFQQYISRLTPDDRSIWKATKKFKRPTAAIPSIKNMNGDWARTDAVKACAFANYLAKVFTPLPANNTEDEI
jgi:hypothetical protein